MNIFIVLTIIIFAYLSPLIIYRLRTKRVNLTFKALDGGVTSTSLLLEKNDPLWKIIEAQRLSRNVSES
jgi:hypothetical protein